MRLSQVALIVMSMLIAATEGTGQTRSRADLQGFIVSNSITAGNQINIELLRLPDSARLQVLEMRSGNTFYLKGVYLGKYLLRLSADGYDTLYVDVKHYDRLTVLPKIQLEKRNNLQAVVVRTSLPVSLKKDTLEFSADFFNTRKFSVVEDLMKKLPGVSVERDGTISAGGEQVRKILIDGNRQYNDPLMATRNLPREMVDRVQLYSSRSDKSEFTGIDDGSRVKTINIVTKKDKRNSLFGKASTGIGNKSLYDHSLNINRFVPSRQITLISQFNNVSRTGFSAQDMLSLYGISGKVSVTRVAASPTGISKAGGIGFNYRESWRKRTELTLNYIYADQQTVNRQNISTTTFVRPDSSLFTRQLLQQQNGNTSHKFSINLEHKLDSANVISIRNTFSHQLTFTSSYRESAFRDQLSHLLANNLSVLKGHSSMGNYSISGVYLHKFLKAGGSFTITFSRNGNTGSINQRTYSASAGSFNGNGKSDTLDNQIQGTNKGREWNFSVNYSEPLAKGLWLESNYGYMYSENLAERITSIKNTATADYSIRDSALSNDFKNSSTSHRVGLAIRYIRDDFKISAGSGMQQYQLGSLDRTNNRSFKRTGLNLIPSMNVELALSKRENLSAAYEGKNQQPDINQLQEVADYSDPLNIKQGNAELKPSFTHNFNFAYSAVGKSNMAILNLSFGGMILQDQISSSVFTILDSSQIPADLPKSTPIGASINRNVNLNGNYAFKANANYSFPMRRPKSNLGLTLQLNRNRSASLLYNPEGKSFSREFLSNSSVTYSIKWNTNLKKNLDVNLNSSTTMTFSSYTGNQQLNGNYFSQSVYGDISYYNEKGWNCTLEIDYRYATLARGFSRGIPLASLSISKQLFRNRALEIKLLVFDLLRQNQSISRSFGPNFIQDTKSEVLTRYLMASVSYNLRIYKNVIGSK